MPLSASSESEALAVAQKWVEEQGELLAARGVAIQQALINAGLTSAVYYGAKNGRRAVTQRVLPRLAKLFRVPMSELEGFAHLLPPGRYAKDEERPEGAPQPQNRRTTRREAAASPFSNDRPAREEMEELRGLADWMREAEITELHAITNSNDEIEFRVSRCIHGVIRT